MTTKPIALITGASTGIGAVYADRLAGRGYDLLLVARNEARLAAVAEAVGTDHGVGVETLRADLTDPADLTRVAARAAEDARIELLLNNAGTAVGGGFLTQDADALGRVIALNVTAPTRLARAVAPRLAEARAGAIVNISSVLALAPEMGMTVYSATKAYMLTLSQGLAGELSGKGVYVQAVLPAATRTEIWERAGRNIDEIPNMMEVGTLVDAALVGFDRRELVTLPSLADEALWTAFDDARVAMGPGFSHGVPGARYLARNTVDA